MPYIKPVFASNRRIEPDLPPTRIIGPSDPVVECIDALRNLSLRPRPEPPVGRAAPVMVSDAAVQTERGVETNRGRVANLLQERDDRRDDQVPPDNQVLLIAPRPHSTRRRKRSPGDAPAGKSPRPRSSSPRRRSSARAPAPAPPPAHAAAAVPAPSSGPSGHRATSAKRAGRKERTQTIRRDGWPRDPALAPSDRPPPRPLMDIPTVAPANFLFSSRPVDPDRRLGTQQLSSRHPMYRPSSSSSSSRHRPDSTISPAFKKPRGSSSRRPTPRSGSPPPPNRVSDPILPSLPPPAYSRPPPADQSDYRADHRSSRPSRSSPPPHRPSRAPLPAPRPTTQGQRKASAVLTAEMKADPIAVRQKISDRQQRWAAAAAAPPPPPPPPTSRPPSSRVVVPRAGPSRPSTLTCTDVRLFEHSTSTTTIRALSFRDSPGMDSDDASPPRSWRPRPAAPPRASPLLPDFGRIVLPDLEPLHRSVDELTLSTSADEFDVDPRG